MVGIEAYLILILAGLLIFLIGVVVGMMMSANRRGWY